MKRKSRAPARQRAASGALVELKRAVKRVAKRMAARAAERERTGPVSAIDLLKKQHAEVKALFKGIETARTRQAKLALFDRLAADLVAHDAIEREIFYPACEKKLGMTDHLGEALVEHGLVEFSLFQSDQARRREEFDFKVQVLSEVVLHHAKEEEDDFFPEVERKLSEKELLRLGGLMRSRFEEAKASDFRAALRNNLNQVLAGALKPSARSGRSAPRSPRSAARRKRAA